MTALSIQPGEWVIVCDGAKALVLENVGDAKFPNLKMRDVYEHKALSGRKGPVTRGEVAEIGKAQVLRTGSDVTILASMLMVERSLAAAETLAADGIAAEVIDLRWVRPIDLPTIRASVERTGRLVVAEEQVHAGGWGATVISELTMGGVAWRSAPRRVSLPDDYPVPYSPPLETLIVPSAAGIAAAARSAVGL